MSAVSAAEDERREARLDAAAERNVEIHREEAESDSRTNAILGALQSMPGANDPNAVLDAGNRQAAAMRSIGDANAAQQRAAVVQPQPQQSTAATEVQQVAQQQTSPQSAYQTTMQATATTSRTPATGPNGFTATGGYPRTSASQNPVYPNVVIVNGSISFNVPSGYHIRSGNLALISSTGTGDANEILQHFNSVVNAINSGDLCHTVGDNAYAGISSSTVSYQTVGGRNVVAACLTIAPDGIPNSVGFQYGGYVEVNMPSTVTMSMRFQNNN